ncbi:MAG TPA: hypothetical protein VJ783_15235 [Pirellulales bacterium]|nr:hypothetical protein [Pirellulales bacterium]
MGRQTDGVETAAIDRVAGQRFGVARHAGGMTPFQGYDDWFPPKTQGCTLGYRMTPVPGYGRTPVLRNARPHQRRGPFAIDTLRTNA